MTNQKASALGLFRNRFVQVILMSGLLLQIGIWVRNYSILLYVTDMTDGSKVAVSLISVAEFLPIFVFSFIGGTFADRWRPKRTMIWCDFLSAVSIFAVLLAIHFGSWKAVFFVTFVSSILSQFSQPSGLKLFKLHVPEELMQTGMSAYQTLFAIFMVLGPGLGTVVYGNLGIEWAIGITGVAFLLSAGVLFFLPNDRVSEQTEGGKAVWEEMKAGFRYVLASKMLSRLGNCFFFAGLGIGLIQPLAIFLITDHLGLPKERLSWLLTVNGIAMLIGGALAIAFASKISPQKLLALGTIVSAVAIAVCGISTVFTVTLVAQFFSGLVGPFIQIGINTMVLRNTEEAFVGRVNGILNPLFMGAMVITMTLGGWLAGLLDLMPVYLLSSVLLLISALILVPLFRQKQEGGSIQEIA
ncbi:MFS transporter [Gorillibacterium timonense]|uniref:MFS transporter n=1 Tax=Gorillibacterium timonense TaxID=1689269 RepID=UPI00071CE0E8|nr:MFS transporter [Gorillibacterium timonense]